MVYIVCNVSFMVLHSLMRWHIVRFIRMMCMILLNQMCIWYVH